MLRNSTKQEAFSVAVSDAVYLVKLDGLVLVFLHSFHLPYARERLHDWV